MSENLRVAMMDIPLARRARYTDELRTAILSETGEGRPQSGTRPCPWCDARLHWTRDRHAARVYARCASPGCLDVLQ